MNYRVALIVAALSVVLISCGRQPIPTANTPDSLPAEEVSTATFTPDPCAAENMEQSIKEVNDRMREFRDAFQLASNVTKEQVPPIISDMQRIRRAAEDQTVPACLAELKKHQLAHMNTVIDTMLRFVSGADSNSLGGGLITARQEYELYTAEMARLLGIEPTATATP